MKKLFLLFISILFACLAFGQSKREAAVPLQKSLLWEISGNGLTSSSYLFGTYHFAGKSFADSLGIVNEKLYACKAVAGELVINKAMAAKMAPAMKLANNNTLDKVFTKNQYDSIAHVLKDITNYDMEVFNTLKPAAIEVLLSAFTAPKSISENNPAIDQYFQDAGRKNGEKIIGLEALEFQVDLLLNSPIEDQKRQLMYTIRKMDTQQKQMDEMYRLYQQQDLDGMDKMMQTDGEFTPAEIERMVKNRNLNWLEQLPAIMQQQPTFIAVGAGHLVGEYGLINLLRKKGYTVNPPTP